MSCSTPRMYTSHVAIDDTDPTPHNTGQNMEKPPTRKQIGAYARISLDDENDRLGVTRQREDIDALAARLGWDIRDYYIDNNISAFKRNVRRPEFERLLADLEAGVIDGIIAYDIDRITRQPSDLERIVQLYEDHRSFLFATCQGSIDLSTSDGIFIARIYVNVANKSSSDTSRRQKRRNRQRAEAGLPHGSRRPYGYELDQMRIHPIEAPILREMGMRLLSGMSYREIAYWMNAEGNRTTQGKLWYPITVRNTLARERYAGFRVYEGVTYEGTWEPVFTRDEWDTMRHVIKERKERLVMSPTNKKHLLTGILVCGKCGAFLNGATKRDPVALYGKDKGKQKPLRPIYNCRVVGDAYKQAGCGGVTRNASALEHYIRELICYRLDTDELGSLLASPGADEKLAKLVSDREVQASRQRVLLDDYTDGLIDRAEFARAKGRVEDRISEIDARIDEVRRSRISVSLNPGETVREAWAANPDGWRRELIGTLINKITVNVGKTKPLYYVDGVRMRFDPNLIEVDWKV